MAAAGARGRAGVWVGTPAGGWRLAWHPERSTFGAAHWRDDSRGSAGTPRVDHHLGAGDGAYASVGALEEALGWPLPLTFRDALAEEQRDMPALAVPRGGVVPEAERPRGVDTYPVWASPASVGADGPLAPYGLFIERDRPLAAVDLGEGSRLEVLAGTPEPAVGGLQVSYRLSHQGRVIFSGDDVNAPPGAQLSSDDSLRALLAMLVDPDPRQRARPFTHPQASFAAAHAERLLAAVQPPAQPLPPGTRIAHGVDGGRHTGTIVHAICGRDAEVLGYAWRPDTAALVGHPWRYQPDHTLISPPDRLSPTLAGPERAIPAAGTPLVFGAVVACVDPASGARVEATVVRAFAGPDGFVYQVQPNTPEPATAFTVAAERCAALAGTWWPTPAELMAARRTAGIDLVGGEVFAHAIRSIGGLADGPPVAPALTPAQRDAALAVDVDEPAPSLVKVSTHGQLTRVGDPGHGWIVVETERWLSAMCRPAEELRAAVAGAAPGLLAGDESRPTLAALAARHAPDTLGPPPAGLVKRFAAPAELTTTGVGL